MFDILGYAVSAASHGIDLSEAVHDLTTQELADYAAAYRDASTRLTAMKFLFTAEWASRYPGDESCHAMYAERPLQVGRDGTPPVGEGAVDEWSDLLGVSNGSVKLFIGDVLDLRHRLPQIWAKLCLGAVEPWQARKIAQACQPLSADACRHVDQKVEPWIGQLSWTRLEHVVTASVIEADPELAQRMADEARAAMGVWNSQTSGYNLKAVFIRADPMTVSWFMATLNLVADGMKADGDQRSADERRAAAVNLLARPVDAAAFLARHATTPSGNDGNCASTNAATGTGETTQPGSQADTPSGSEARPGGVGDNASASAADTAADTAQPGGQAAAPASGGTTDTTPDPDNTQSSGQTDTPAGGGTTNTTPEELPQPSTDADPQVGPGTSNPELPETPTQPSADPSAAPSPAAETDADTPRDAERDAGIEPIRWDLDAEPDPDVDEACVAEWTPGWNAAPPWDGSTADIPLPDEPDDTHCRCGHDTDAAEPHLRLNVSLPAGFDKNAARAAKPRIVLHYHLSCDGLHSKGTQALVRPEHADPMRLTELLDVLKQTGCMVKVQPVIDPANTAPADAYEIPDRIRDAVRYRDCAEVTPWGTSMSRSLDLDHTQPWREAGPPGQTSYANLGPLSRPPHRVKTLGLKHVRQPDPGTFLWRSRNGHLSIVTNRGTINLGRSDFTADLWNLATPPTRLPALGPGRFEISTFERVAVKLIRKHFHTVRSEPD